MAGPLFAHPRPRSFARARRSLGGAEPRRSRRRSDQGRASRLGRRLARFRSALGEGQGRARHADSAYYTSANRGKKSITLNISKPDGQKLARELAAISDVLIENYKFGDLARYGLSYEDLKKTNPRLIYCSVTGFGQTARIASAPATTS